MTRHNCRGLSQEGLKLIACITMLLDHIGAVLLPWPLLRDIGRISFPIFCFLVAEGVYHTRSPKKYALRLLLGAVLAEIPFDLVFFGGITWGHQNVMLTLLLGFLALTLAKQTDQLLLKLLVTVPFALIARWCHTDYASTGVMLIVMFGLSRELPGNDLLRTGLMLLLFAGMPSVVLLRFGGLIVTQQMLGTLSIIPIALYSGEKITGSKAVQVAFYLFYPLHLTVLYLIRL